MNTVRSVQFSSSSHKTPPASPFATAAVIGGGAWGTALAALLTRNGVKTLIWAREAETVASINEAHENRPYLPGVLLPKTLVATSALKDAADREAYLFVAPAQYARGLFAELGGIVPGGKPLALSSKGIEQRTGLMLTEVLKEVWPTARRAVLSGPSFARDVALGLPTAVTLADENEETGRRWAASVGAPHFRPYLSGDLTGAALGGAVKNVLAIAAGAVEGRGLGDSARAAIIARGFAEFTRLGVALGAKAETLAGLSGLGDLILTATSTQSRNMSLGIELGRGRSLKDILAERNSVAEGVATAPALLKRADDAGVDMPVARAVSELVCGAKTLDQIIGALLMRPFTIETR